MALLKKVGHAYAKGTKQEHTNTHTQQETSALARAEISIEDFL